MKPSLVVILGETGSGKSALAMHLAKEFGGEIISADSRAVYRGMDIGTAKPSAQDQLGVRHYGIDVVNPDEPFSAHDFQKLAKAAIDEITFRGKLPILVGGTGLYIDAVIYDFTFRPKPDLATRDKLNSLSIDELQTLVRAAGLSLPANARNPRHLVRLLEAGEPPKQRELRQNTLLLGLSIPHELLKARIERRVEGMVEAGLVEEVRSLSAIYKESEVLKAPGYKAIAAYLDSALTIEEAKRLFVHSDLLLAKRQRTWFRRNKNIHWLTSASTLDEATALVKSFLNR